MTDFRPVALKLFSTLLDECRKSERILYWRVGHAFDTMLDYLAIDNSVKPDILSLARDRFLYGGGFWYDDFAWWGIGCLRASEMPVFDENEQASFWSMSDYCWHAVDGFAPYVWDRVQNKQAHPDREPKFSGGVWNSCWSDVDDTCAIKLHDDALFGVQNTVTNTLYLVHAARLYLNDQKWNTWRNEVAYLNAAIREFNFLNSWLTDPTLSAIEKLLLPISGGFSNWLIRERVSVAKNGYMDYRYRPDLAWTGDQGLFIGGLSALMQIADLDGVSDEKYLTLARSCLGGIQQGLIDSTTGRFIPWLALDGRGAPGGDTDNYSTGPGVLMRYLLDAWRRSPQLKTIMINNGLAEAIVTFADYAVAHPDTSTGLIGPANDLATLLAAIEISKN